MKRIALIIDQGHGHHIGETIDLEDGLVGVSELDEPVFVNERGLAQLEEAVVWAELRKANAA